MQSCSGTSEWKEDRLQSIANIFKQTAEEVASLAVPQPPILMHSTDPNNPIVCSVEDQNTSVAAKTWIETSALRQIVPPTSLEKIVPTILVATCGTAISVERESINGTSKHQEVKGNAPAQGRIDFEQKNVQKLHTVYGSTSVKLYKAV